MKVLLAYSSEQLGYDPVVEQLRAQFTAQCANSTVSAINVDQEPTPTHEFDLVVLLNATAWYIKNRLKLSGRYDLYGCSFCLTDFLALLRVNIPGQELGFRGFFSTCAECVKQYTAALPMNFTWKPLALPKIDAPEPEPSSVGSVLWNVADRDFSQFLLTAELMKKKEAEPVLYLSSDEKMRVPAAVEPYTQRVNPRELFNYFHYLKYYVPTPRITDYRSGILPSEIIQAVAAGSVPLFITHPLINRFSEIVSRFHDSVSSYEATLHAIVEGATPVVVRPGIEKFYTTPEDYVAKILTAHYRLKANVTSEGAKV